MNSIYIILKDLRTGKIFKKYFITEFERDKFIRKLKYSKNITLIYKEGDSNE